MATYIRNVYDNSLSEVKTNNLFENENAKVTLNTHCVKYELPLSQYIKLSKTELAKVNAQHNLYNKQYTEIVYTNNVQKKYLLDNCEIVSIDDESCIRLSPNGRYILIWCKINISYSEFVDDCDDDESDCDDCDDENDCDENNDDDARYVIIIDTTDDTIKRDLADYKPVKYTHSKCDTSVYMSIFDNKLVHVFDKDEHMSFMVDFDTNQVIARFDEEKCLHHFLQLPNTVIFCEPCKYCKESELVTCYVFNLQTNTSVKKILTKHYLLALKPIWYTL